MCAQTTLQALSWVSDIARMDGQKKPYNQLFLVFRLWEVAVPFTCRRP